MALSEKYPLQNNRGNTLKCVEIIGERKHLKSTDMTWIDGILEGGYYLIEPLI
jgi:hypothetical protein